MAKEKENDNDIRDETRILMKKRKKKIKMKRRISDIKRGKSHG